MNGSWNLLKEIITSTDWCSQCCHVVQFARHFHPRVLSTKRIEVIKMAVIKYPCLYKVITTKKEKLMFSALTPTYFKMNDFYFVNV
jgi:hypothetical protein